MKYTVKFNIHDWPKRGSFMRGDIDVDANTDNEAVQIATPLAQAKWTHGKIKIYDVVRDRIEAWVQRQAEEQKKLAAQAEVQASISAATTEVDLMELPEFMRRAGRKPNKYGIRG